MSSAVRQTLTSRGEELSLPAESSERPGGCGGESNEYIHVQNQIISYKSGSYLYQYPMCSCRLAVQAFGLRGAPGGTPRVLSRETRLVPVNARSYQRSVRPLDFLGLCQVTEVQHEARKHQERMTNPAPEQQGVSKNGINQHRGHSIGEAMLPHANSVEAEPLLRLSFAEDQKYFFTTPAWLLPSFLQNQLATPLQRYPRRRAGICPGNLCWGLSRGLKRLNMKKPTIAVGLNH